VLQDTLSSSLSRVVGRYCYDDWTNQLQKLIISHGAFYPQLPRIEPCKMAQRKSWVRAPSAAQEWFDAHSWRRTSGCFSCSLRWTVWDQTNRQRSFCGSTPSLFILMRRQRHGPSMGWSGRAPAAMSPLDQKQISRHVRTMPALPSRRSARSERTPNA